ncbi:hypothetical protein A8709_25615 [Paenibacillus pectinilyticus]|uniref:Uncharacterized protein n=1 Tax=Paenibacillus pectinilyticus TaxID=512399 RepID=A0A1C1A129_9BACL|nr:hypothetical protein A8709_25615 [Paenibacillus pectinilyticus]
MQEPRRRLIVLPDLWFRMIKFGINDEIVCVFVLLHKGTVGGWAGEEVPKDGEREIGLGSEPMARDWLGLARVPSLWRGAG